MPAIGTETALSCQKVPYSVCIARSLPRHLPQRPTPRNTPKTRRAPQTALSAIRHQRHKSHTKIPHTTVKSLPRILPRTLPKMHLFRGFSRNKQPSAVPAPMCRLYPARCRADTLPKTPYQTKAQSLPLSFPAPCVSARPSRAAAALAAAAPSVPPASAIHLQRCYRTAQQAAQQQCQRQHSVAALPIEFPVDDQRRRKQARRIKHPTAQSTQQ